MDRPQTLLAAPTETGDLAEGDPPTMEIVTPAGPASATPASPRDQMERVLQLFFDRAAVDTALREFAAKRSVSSHYFVNDLGLEFHIGFRDGRVVTGLGAPAQPAEVRLKAKAETLDAILTGRLSGNKAAMTGRLSLSGDVRLAMGMQKIQGDVVRVYSAARKEAGGIDFSGLSRAPSVTAAATSQAPEPARVVADAMSAGRPTTPAAVTLRDEVAQVTEELFAAQLITATGGNVSARIPGTNEAWISPTQLFKGRLSAEMMVRIDLDGNALDPEAPAPSSERLVHCEIYKARPDVEAVVHAHAAYATILGLSGLPFLPVTTEAAFLADLPRVPFIMPGSRELAAAVQQALGTGTAVLMQNHGLVVAAGSLRHAANTAEVIERVSQLIWGCYAVGKKPQALPKDVLVTLREIGRMLA